MGWFEIHTKEQVDAIYRTEAYDERDARRQFELGQLTKPVFYEAVDVDIVEIKDVT